MSKTVKLMTVVDGQNRAVGHCHPGQARLLQKQGLAAWREGKLWFHTPPEDLDRQREPEDVAAEWKLFTEPYADRYAEGEHEGIYSRSVQSLVNPWTARALDTLTAASRIRHKPHTPRTVVYPDVTEWLEEIEHRRVNGHDLTVYADRKRVGVSNGYLALEVTREIIEATTDEDLARIGLKAEPFKKAMESRWSLVRLLLRGDREEFLDGLEMLPEAYTTPYRRLDGLDLPVGVTSTVEVAPTTLADAELLLGGLEATVRAARLDDGPLPVPTKLYMPVGVRNASIRSLGHREWNAETGEYVVETTGGVRPEQTLPAGRGRGPETQHATEDGRVFKLPASWKPKHPGWASFAYPEDMKRLPMAAPDDHLENLKVFWTCSGFYRRLRRRLYRFWTDAKGGVHFDESEINSNGVYEILNVGVAEDMVEAKLKAEGLYEEHTARKDPTMVYINGSLMAVEGDHLDYVQVVVLAGYPEDATLSVVYKGSPDGNGTLIPGEILRIKFGTVINAMDTSNA
jgi:hypothetical protein